MKTIYYLLISTSLIFTLSNSFAQETSIGAKGGFNISTLGGSDLDTKPRFSSYIGGKINIYVEEKMSIQPELYFSWQGTRYDVNDETTKLNLTFLNLPVLYKYWYKPELNFYGGIQMGIKLSAKEKTEGEKQPIHNEIKTLDFSLVIGTEYYFTDNIAAEIRFNYGLTDLIENPFVTQQYKQRVFQFGGSYYF